MPCKNVRSVAIPTCVLLYVFVQGRGEKGGGLSCLAGLGVLKYEYGLRSAIYAPAQQEVTGSLRLSRFFAHFRQIQLAFYVSSAVG